MVVRILIPVEVISNVYKVIIKTITDDAAISDNATIYINKIWKLCTLFTSNRVNNLPSFANIITGL